MLTTVRTQSDLDSLPAECGDIQILIRGDVVLPLLAKAGDIYAPAATAIDINGIAQNSPEQERAALAAVAGIILAEDGRWDQGTYGPDACPGPECGTPMCLAGWLRALDPRPKVRAMTAQVAGMLIAPAAYRAGAFGGYASELVKRLVREATT